jgi:uncharacterized protein YecE (DUF72 family)
MRSKSPFPIVFGQRWKGRKMNMKGRTRDLSKKDQQEIKIGCCGFAVSQKEYFELFRIIEIQNTFYQLPEIRTAEKWRLNAPPGFEFTMKAWQLITHEPSSPTYRRLKERIDRTQHAKYGRFQTTPQVLDAWERTFLFAQTLGATVIVFQCPASFRPTRENTDHMREFFGRAERAGLRYAWEPRGKWPEDLVLRLCEDLDLIHCVDPFKNRTLYGELQYFRLHGITGYDYSYTDEDLMRLSRWIEGKPSHILFNNKTMKEDAIKFMNVKEAPHALS